ncbi:hypothetical protein [Paraflavitalea speifideaquila]|uniref:hypothetical protein n=1 Tax=Paraflavitalea speifideaquila TaxID=3076558 RepID=UPI0028E89DC0|nr:hypothetical protein [Paraflavitalea speifideiaquila]
MSADVTDINGETRSGNASVAVAYQALQLKVGALAKLHTDSIKTIQVNTTNFNDLFEQATVTLTIHKLKVPERSYRNRYWEQPDQFVLTQQEYQAAFPYDIYKNENEVSTWEKERRYWNLQILPVPTESLPSNNLPCQPAGM